MTSEENNLMKTENVDFKNSNNKFPIQKSILQWSDFTVTTKNESKIILNGLTGEIKSGEALAIMGSSGAGKTTFLNYLSKKSGSSIEGLKKKSGEVRFVVDNIDQTNSYQILSGYVTQDDVLYENLTPRELFKFAADIRHPHKTDAEKEELVLSLIDRLGLEKCADTYVGDVLTKGLSGGERKRTAIGYELITEPYILFLDEPTTGLDSVSAYKVIKLITEEAKINNRLIIFTIHQPNTEIFKLFDKLLLLAEGKVMFHGDCSYAIDYFSSLGYNCPTNFNPAEFYIKVLSKESKQVEVLDIEKEWENKNGQAVKNLQSGERHETYQPLTDSSRTSVDLALDEKDFLKDANEYEQTLTKINEKFKQENNITDLSNLPSNKNTIAVARNNFLVEFGYLFQRNRKVLIRNATAFILRLVMTIFNSFLVIMVFNSLGKGNNAIQDRNGCLFFFTTSVVQANLQTNLLMFSQEKPKFYKEQESSMYRVLTYFLSKTILEIPMQIMLSLITFFCGYFFAGLNTNDYDNFFIFILTICLAGYTGSSFAIFLSSLFDKKEIIPAIFPFLLYTQIQASGYLSNLNNIPYIFYPFKYISVFRYTYQALCWNEYTGVTPQDLDCQIPGKCKIPTFDFPEDLTMCLICLAILAVANNILAVISLKIKIMLRQVK